MLAVQGMSSCAQIRKRVVCLFTYGACYIERNGLIAPAPAATAMATAVAAEVSKKKKKYHHGWLIKIENCHLFWKN